MRSLGILLVAAILSIGCGAGAQQSPRAIAASERVYRVGLMTFDDPVWNGWTQAFRDGMRELGYVEGQNVVVVEAPADDGNLETTLAVVRELQSDGVDVIVSSVLPHHITEVSKAAGSTPFVEALLNSPNVGVAPISSYARPGGNVTGIIAIDVAQHARRLQLLKEVAPHVSRVIVLTPWDRPADLPGWPEIVEMARTLSVEVERVQPSGPDDIESALQAAIERGGDGLLQYQGNPFGNLAVRQRVTDVAAIHRLPAVYIDKGWARLGGLMAYTPDVNTNWKRAATYVDRILKGANAGDLPIEQPATFDFLINVKTAQSLDLTIPQAVLAQASELVQ